MTTSEWLTAVGDDNVTIQNVRENLTKIRLVRKGREVQLTIVTSPQFINPNDVAAGREQYVGLIVWVPKALSDNVLDSKRESA